MKTSHFYLVFLDQPLHGLQLLDPPFHGQRPPRLEGLAGDGNGLTSTHLVIVLPIPLGS